jgi:Domain of unknown function (DUF3883)
MWPRCLRTCASSPTPVDSDAGLAAVVPTRHQLRAALQVMRAVDSPTTRLADLRHAYLTLPSGGVFHVDDLIAGEALLVECGLLGRDADTVMVSLAFPSTFDLPEETAMEVLALRVLAARAPVWLAAAAADEQLRPELIPDRDADALARLIDDAEQREALLLAAQRTVDQQAKAQLGEAGEELVVQAARDELRRRGRPDLAAQVCRLSVVSDQLGYDVRLPRLDGEVWRAEVKATRAAHGPLRVYLSRGETEAARRLPDWILVICHIPLNGNSEVVGWCSFNTLRCYLPKDQHQHGRWDTVQIRLAPSELAVGLPPLG